MLIVQDLQYVVKNSANKKENIHLLCGVSGILYPHEMTALVRAEQGSEGIAKNVSVSADSGFDDRQHCIGPLVPPTNHLQRLRNSQRSWGSVTGFHSHLYLTWPCVPGWTQSLGLSQGSQLNLGMACRWGPAAAARRHCLVCVLHVLATGLEHQ